MRRERSKHGRLHIDAGHRGRNGQLLVWLLVDKLYLTPAEVADLLNCDPQAIRDAARHNPEQLGFPTMRVGNRTKIPRMPFLRWLGIEEE